MLIGIGGVYMNFELWLFTIKQLGQTMDVAKMIYDGLSEQEKERLKKEYEEYTKK